MADRKIGLKLTYPEYLKKDANLSTTSKYSFDDLSEFISEKGKIERIAEDALKTELKVDFSDFSNHVFFDSAVAKFGIAKNKVLNDYPFNGNAEEKDAHFLSGTQYDEYIFDQWPRYVGYVDFISGSDQYISASDTDRKLIMGSSSFGISVWLNVAEVSPSFTSSVVYYISESAGPVYTGFSIGLHSNTGVDVTSSFLVVSGSSVARIVYPIPTGSFVNIASTFCNQTASIYVNGELVKTGVPTADIGSMEFAATIPFLIGSSSFSTYTSFSGSMNEFRYFHTASANWISDNYNRPIDAEDFLKLHYKFNESVTGTGSIDQVIVDYSKSGLHGRYLNYSSDSRTSGSVMVDDPGDPILYSFHSDVVSFTSSIDFSASFYDAENNKFILNMIPGGVLEEDNFSQGLLQSFCLAMGRYFDEIKLYIDQFDNLRVTNYDGVDESPDLFLSFLKDYFGWKVTEHFGDTDPLSFFFGSGVLNSGSLEVPLVEVKDQFWRRILNNLPYLYKTKGKRSNLDAFLNVLGINKENIRIKEFGYSAGSSIQDSRIHRDKVVAALGITGSFKDAFVRNTSLVASPNNSFTVESYVRFSASSNFTSGSLWQFVDSADSESVTLLWNSTDTELILTASDGESFSASIDIFDGEFTHIAAGLNDKIPFIYVTRPDTDEVNVEKFSISSSFEGSGVVSGAFTGSDFDFIIGANSGSLFNHETEGWFSEVRYWNRALSASEIYDHALHFESVGIKDILELPNPLVGHWALNNFVTASSAGTIENITDLSQNGNDAIGWNFDASYNPFKKFLRSYDYLNADVDLRYTQNKIRVYNKSKLTSKDACFDNDEVSIEFNLIDSLNEDIAKIFSTFDKLNDSIGKPINKYRDEYTDLESYRRVYFERLGDSLNFTSFFKLFRWFDKKISDAIKQLLPVRVSFIGGEQVVESHALERPKLSFKYPIFRTPKTIPEMEITASAAITGSSMNVFNGEISAISMDSVSILIMSSSVPVPDRLEITKIDGQINNTNVSKFDNISNDSQIFRKRSVENLALNSNNFEAATWSYTFLSASSVATDPFGGEDAILVFDTDDDESHYFESAVYDGFVTIQAGKRYVLSGYFKSVDQDFVFFQLAPDSWGSYYCIVSGTLGSTYLESTTTVFGIQDAGDDWYRCYMAFTVDEASLGGDASKLSGIRVGAAAADLTSSYAGGPGNPFAVYGIQLEEVKDGVDIPSEFVTTGDNSNTKTFFDSFLQVSKLSGDDKIDTCDSNSGINFRNEWVKQMVAKKDRDNEE